MKEVFIRNEEAVAVCSLLRRLSDARLITPEEAQLVFPVVTALDEADTIYVVPFKNEREYHPHIIVTGDPVTGLSFVGPFSKRDDAESYAEHIEDTNAWVASLDAPEA